MHSYLSPRLQGSQTYTNKRYFLPLQVTVLKVLRMVVVDTIVVWCFRQIWIVGKLQLTAIRETTTDWFVVSKVLTDGTIKKPILALAKLEVPIFLES